MIVQNLEIITLNVNCLGRPVSRAGLVDFIERILPDLLCLQECNVLSEDLQRNNFKALVYLDTTDEKAREQL